tara:strand:+ start:1073 stop:1588 length:516 start_codon:yes stop_codon:yes gene_type:complete
MVQYALIKNNEVINRVIEIPSPLPDDVTLLETSGSASNIAIGDYWDSDNNLVIKNTIISIFNSSTFLDSDNNPLEIDSYKVYGTGSNNYTLRSNNNINNLSISNLSSKIVDISNFEFNSLSSSFDLTIKPECSNSTEEIFVDFKIDLEGIVDDNNNPVSYSKTPLYFTRSI